jgi:hypothetical protein
MDCIHLAHNLAQLYCYLKDYGFLDHLSDSCLILTQRLCLVSCTDINYSYSNTFESTCDLSRFLEVVLRSLHNFPLELLWNSFQCLLWLLFILSWPSSGVISSELLDGVTRGVSQWQGEGTVRNPGKGTSIVGSRYPRTSEGQQTQRTQCMLWWNADWKK